MRGLMHNIQRVTFESASCILRKEETHRYSLTNLYSVEVRKGHATGLMQKVIALADEHDFRIWLTARQYGNPHGMPTELLIPFYKRFGFKLLPQGVMVRDSQKLHSL